MAGILIYLKCWSKVGLESNIVENAKIRYGWGFNLFKMLKKIWLGSNIVENANIRHAQGTAGFFYYSKSKN